MNDYRRKKQKLEYVKDNKPECIENRKKLILYRKILKWQVNIDFSSQEQKELLELNLVRKEENKLIFSNPWSRHCFSLSWVEGVLIPEYIRKEILRLIEDRDLFVFQLRLKQLIFNHTEVIPDDYSNWLEKNISKLIDNWEDGNEPQHLHLRQVFNAHSSSSQELEDIKKSHWIYEEAFKHKYPQTKLASRREANTQHLRVKQIVDNLQHHIQNVIIIICSKIKKYKILILFLIALIGIILISRLDNIKFDIGSMIGSSNKADILSIFEKNQQEGLFLALQNGVKLQNEIGNNNSQITDASSAKPIFELSKILRNIHVKTRLYQYNAPIRAVSFSSDATQLAVGGEDQKIHTYNIKTVSDNIKNYYFSHFVTKPKDSKPIGKTVTSLSFNTNVDKLVLALAVDDSNERIKFYDPSKNEMSEKLDNEAKNEINQEEIYDIGFSTDGKYLFTLDKGNNAKLWELKNDVYVLSNKQFDTTEIESFAFNPKSKIHLNAIDQSLLAIATKNYIKIYNLADLNARPKMIKKSAKVHSISFSYDNRYISATTDNNRVYVWDLSKQLSILSDATYELEVKEAKFTPWKDFFGSYSLLVIDQDYRIKLWDFLNKQTYKFETLAPVPTNSSDNSHNINNILDFHPTENFMVTLGTVNPEDKKNKNKKLLLWDLTKLNQKANNNHGSFLIGNKTDIISQHIYISQVEKNILYFIFLNRDNIIRIYDLADKKLNSIDLKPYESSDSLNNVDKLVFSRNLRLHLYDEKPSLKLIATVESSGDNSKIRLWNLSSKNLTKAREILELPTIRGKVIDLQFSPERFKNESGGKKFYPDYLIATEEDENKNIWLQYWNLDEELHLETLINRGCNWIDEKVLDPKYQDEYKRICNSGKTNSFELQNRNNRSQVAQSGQ
ncbi:MAG: hypothetical protein AAGE84_09505 [Cyanobacteria bacterium P01_G01_bin.39]